VKTEGGRARRVVHVLAALAVGYLVLCVLGCAGYRSLLYPAPHDAGPRVPPGATLRTFTASDGLVVTALHFAAPPGQPTVVHFHGNGESLRGDALFGARLHEEGVGVLLVEYRGYGSSPGSPTEDGLYRDARAALEGLAADGVPKEKIVVCGTSLGTGVAAEMAARGLAGIMILISPYTSIPRVAARVVPFLPTSILVGDRYDTLAKAPAIAAPTLVIHGGDDEVIPYSMGREVTAAIPGARLVTVPHGHHNDLFQVDPGLYAQIAADARGDHAAAKDTGSR
jgi:hypothetical protein